MRWFLAIIVILFVSLVLQAGLVAFAGYVLLGVFALSRYLARKWIDSLDAELAINDEPREIGDAVEVTVTVTNTGTLMIPWALAEHAIAKEVLRQRKLRIEGRRLRVLFLRAGKSQKLKYTATFDRRGYYQFGPLFLESGDVFGLHRRHKVLTRPAFVLVYPKVLPLARYDFSSERPIGEIRLANRLFEDPTRTAGVRPYQLGDPLQRIHWRATARTGELHSRVYEPTSLAGATVLLDFHADGYPNRNEPHRSELAVTIAASIASAVATINQQIGLVSNGRDATERIAAEALLPSPPGGVGLGVRGGSPIDLEIKTRAGARERFEEKLAESRLRPVTVDTRRGYDQFQQIRETLARLELSDGLTFADLALEAAPKLPRDATLIAVLPRVPVETSLVLGQLRRRGFAVSAILVGMGDDGSDTRAVSAGRLIAEGIRDVRFVNSELGLRDLGNLHAQPAPAEYAVSVELA